MNGKKDNKCHHIGGAFRLIQAMNKDMERNLNEWKKAFIAGDFDDCSTSTQIEAGWYDWFCESSALVDKTKELAMKLFQIMDSDKFDNEKCYVWFKNNCPLCGDLYDDFRIADLETGNTLYTITPWSGHESDNGRAEVWGIDNDFKEPLSVGNWLDVLKFFLNK